MAEGKNDQIEFLDAKELQGKLNTKKDWYDFLKFYCKLQSISILSRELFLTKIQKDYYEIYSGRFEGR